MKRLSSFIKEDIALSLEYHDVLNPLIWETDSSMKKKVQARLLQIGKMWAEFAKIPEEAIRDIVLTGGNANFNYTPYSDLDIHVMVDMSKLPIQGDLLDDFLFSKKILWAHYHPNLTVMGYPVELYAQNYREKVATSQGVYSIEKGKWLAKPKHEKHPDFITDKALLKKIEEYMNMIERILSEPGEHTSEIEKLKGKLHAMRGAGIQRSGEFSMENLIYKDLRNKGYLDKLNDYLQKKNDAMLSLY